MKNISTDNFNFDKKKREMLTEDMRGEQSVSGSQPEPDSDDDVDDIEHEMGLYLNEKEGHPKEAGLAQEVQKAEEEHFEKGV